MITTEDVKRIVYNHLKDDYYIKLRDLESDVDFFNLYMKRNSKSEFRFNLRISYIGSYRAFDDIWKRYGWLRSELESAFAEFYLLRFVILDIYENTNIYTDEEIRDFISYFERYDELKIKDYVSDFVGCSLGCSSVCSKIYVIKNNVQNNERPDAEEEVCEWKYEKQIRYASSRCGFGFDAQRIRLDKFKYCPYCKKKIKVVK